MPLTGRMAVVTGAAGGIGSAVVHGLVSQGAAVHGLDLHPVACPAGVNYHPVDLANRTGTDRVLRRLSDDLGGVCDILVNGAGISRVRPFDTSDDTLLDSLLEVNFTAAFRVTRALLPALRASGRASIVNSAFGSTPSVRDPSTPRC